MSPQRRDATVPAPFVVKPSGIFEGSDGAWSTFIIDVGTPPQQFRVDISFLSGITVLPNNQSCPVIGSTSLSARNCSSLRGVAAFQGGVSLGFQSDSSRTWVDGSLGTLPGPSDLYLGNLSTLFGANYNLAAEFGRDTVALSSQSSAAGVSSDRSTVALLTDVYSFTLGSLGLQPGDIDVRGTPQQTFMQSLANSNQIPSLSWAYTAGAGYLSNPIAGSLVLGGYDQLRIAEQNATFLMPVGTQKTTLQVKVNDILMHQGNTVTSLVTNADSEVSPFTAILDPTLPYLYLPDSVCDSLNSTLGLVYDSYDDLYYWAGNHSDSVLSNLVFTLADTQEGNNQTSINLPFAALNLKTSWPILDSAGNPLNFFPIRKTPPGSDTFILGRALFQEAYVIADFERASFTVAPAAFPTTDSTQLVTIFNTTYNPSTSSGTGSGGGLSGGAIAGIVIGVVGALAFAAIAIFLWRRKKRQQNKDNSAGFAAVFDHTQEEKLGQQSNRDRRNTYDSTFSGNTVTSHEMAALPAGIGHRPSHSRHISELSSDSETTQQNKIRTPSAIYELADTAQGPGYLSASEQRARSTSPAVEAASREISTSPVPDAPSPLLSATSPNTREPFSAISEAQEDAGRPSPSTSPLITRQLSATPTRGTSRFTEERSDMQP